MSPVLIRHRVRLRHDRACNHTCVVVCMVLLVVQVLAMVKYYRVLKDVTGTVTDSDKEFSKFYPWKYNALFKVKRWMEDFDSG